MKLYITEFGDRKKALIFTKEKKLGYEIQRFCLPHRLDSLEREIEILKKDIIDIQNRSIHGPFRELIPASTDPRIIDIVKLRFEQVYKLSKQFKIGHLILHSGFIPKTHSPEEWLERTTNFWQEFMSDKDDEIQIHIENILENEFYSLSQLIKELNHPAFSVCLDIGHANANSDLQVSDWIRGLGNIIGYVHLHNNNGMFDDHFGLHRGTININSVLNLLKENSPNAICSLETNDLEESFKWLEQNRLLHLFDNI